MDRIFKALSDINRRRILSLLKTKEMSVYEILKSFNITQATLSSHLGVLRKAKLVDFKIRGRERIYFLNQELFVKFVDELTKFIGNRTPIIRPDDEIRIRSSR